MSAECLKAAEELYVISAKKAMVDERIAAAAELFTTTGNKKYLDAITSQKEYILAHMPGTAWAVGMIYKNITDAKFRQDMDKAVIDFAARIDKENAGTPFGVPYKPDVWGDGWDIQIIGCPALFPCYRIPWCIQTRQDLQCTAVCSWLPSRN